MLKKRVSWLLGLLVFCLILSGTAFAGGKVFLGGGSLQDDNAEVWNALHAAAGGGTPKVAVFCSASPSLADGQDSYYNDTTEYWSWEHLFLAYGFDPVFIPIALDNYQTAAYDQNLVNIVNGVDVVWFNGGDQSRHARCLLTDNGSDTPLMAAVRTVFNGGGVVAGSSAGAAIMGEYTYGEGISYGYLEANGMIYKTIASESLADPNNYDNGGYMTGFGFLTGLDACVDTHVGGRGRIGRMIVAMRELQTSFVIGMDENSAMVIDNGVGTVYGQYGALIVDGTYASYPSDTYFVANGLLAHSLSTGDQYNFNTRTVTSSKSLITNPYYSSPYESSDIFKTDEAFVVMERLVDSDGTTVSAYSFEKRPRFYLDFSKNSYSKGYWSDGKYTVEALDLIIRWSTR